MKTPLFLLIHQNFRKYEKLLHSLIRNCRIQESYLSKFCIITHLLEEMNSPQDSNSSSSYLVATYFCLIIPPSLILSSSFCSRFDFFCIKQQTFLSFIPNPRVKLIKTESNESITDRHNYIFNQLSIIYARLPRPH